MEKDLLDGLYQNLPKELLERLEAERISASLITEARQLLESRGFVYGSTEDPELVLLHKKIPEKLQEMIDRKIAVAAHFTEARRLLDSPLYYSLRTHAKVDSLSNITDFLKFDETTGEVIENIS
jgi:hypothetical protein